MVCTCLCRKFTQSNLSSEGISAENTHYVFTHNIVYRGKCPNSSKIPTSSAPLWARLSVTAASTEDMISGGPVKRNEHVWRTYSTCWSYLPTQKVRSEAESLTRHNQQVLIGGVNRLDWAQVSPMRHRAGPELSGAFAKWGGNTIKCQGQLNYKCIRPSSQLLG